MNFELNDEVSLEVYIYDKYRLLRENDILKSSIENLNKKSLDILNEVNNRFALIDLERYEIIEKQ